MLDLMTALELPVLLAVGNKLGCINHALLAIEALKARGLHGLGMVLCRISRGTSDEAELLADNVAVLARGAKLSAFPCWRNCPFCRI